MVVENPEVQQRKEGGSIRSLYLDRIKPQVFLAFLCFSVILSGCRTFREATRAKMEDGFYKRNSSIVYVDAAEDSVQVYETEKLDRDSRVIVEKSVVYPRANQLSAEPELVLKRSRLDFDLLTVPAKFRPERDSVPHQWVAPVNINFFLGVRKDRFKMRYDIDPLGKYNRRDFHIGYSFGIFAGMGNAFISPTYTNFRYQGEYFGFLLSGGLAATLALDNFTIGLVAGLDHLTDRYGDIWVYQHQPYLGFALGINLN